VTVRKLPIVVLAMLVGGCTTTAVPTAAATRNASTQPASPAPLSTLTAPTSLPTPRPTPTPVLAAPCPDIDSPSLFEFTEADPACFPGDILLSGWLSGPPAIGWEGPHVEPAWLYYPMKGGVMLWSVVPEGEDPGCPPPGPVQCASIFLHVAPGSGVEIGALYRWTQVVGHIHDPAAATCHFEYPDEPHDNPWGTFPDIEARAQCDLNFVVTRVGEVADG